MITEKAVELIIVGLPLSMSGRYSESCFRAISFAEKVLKLSGKTVLMIDETLTTDISRQYYQLSPGKFRKVKDSLSAMRILERYLRGTRSYPLRESFPESNLTELKIPENMSILIYEPVSPQILTEIGKFNPKSVEVFTTDPQIALKVNRKGFIPKNLETDLELPRYDIMVLKNTAIPCNIESDRIVFY